MTEPRLDRLSALLEGLAPRVWPSDAGRELSLHIVRAASPDAEAAQIDALHLHVSPPGQGVDGLALRARGLSIWLSFEVAFDGPVGRLFLEEFRQPLEIGLAQADPSLIQVVHLIASELETRRCGQPLFMNRAGDILLIGLLRHLVSAPLGTMRLFNGLADPRIARTLVGMHADPASPWTLTGLALEAGMSRTSYANRFKTVMGLPPGKYLENLRLALAHRLVANGIGLKRVARETGYAGPSTLSRAMHRAA
ncbi:helix-turn-helix domain-containing protein [Hydrogenophaga sp.]|jgi:AraC-like DNA-binding protein|uniref:helix-turn-helix domain-containing protein n=1 Tax=Hydrogenophaga sp. TaxID=1904254 RepID=UPI00272EF15D|nr:helix-turn-helix domain-containing protein [Hydrogenophaga sp.]MDP1686229.1 helix-turn-helix domain-containing protein [Hydrogenophaga sp.]